VRGARRVWEYARVGQVPDLAEDARARGTAPGYGAPPGYPAASTLEARKDALSDKECRYVPRCVCSQAAERSGAKEPSGAGIAG